MHFWGLGVRGSVGGPGVCKARCTMKSCIGARREEAQEMTPARDPPEDATRSTDGATATSAEVATATPHRHQDQARQRKPFQIK